MKERMEKAANLGFTARLFIHGFFVSSYHSDPCISWTLPFWCTVTWNQQTKLQRTYRFIHCTIFSTVVQQKRKLDFDSTVPLPLLFMYSTTNRNVASQSLAVMGLDSVWAIFVFCHQQRVDQVYKRCLLPGLVSLVCAACLYFIVRCRGNMLFSLLCPRYWMPLLYWTYFYRSFSPCIVLSSMKSLI